jgi:hypothetical protein
MVIDDSNGRALETMLSIEAIEESALDTEPPQGNVEAEGLHSKVEAIEEVVETKGPDTFAKDFTTDHSEAEDGTHQIDQTFRFYMEFTIGDKVRAGIQEIGTRCPRQLTGTFGGAESSQQKRSCCRWFVRKLKRCSVLEIAQLMIRILTVLLRKEKKQQQYLIKR